MLQRYPNHLNVDSGAVRTLTPDRPEALNAFNSAMFDGLADALLLAADEDSIKVVIITGAGRAFSAGLDLAENSGHQSQCIMSFSHGS